MGTWNTRGLRGSNLEDLINFSNEKYRELNLGIVQKVPTPITPIKIDKTKGHITLAYFEKKSTVDYIGVIQSVPICFDAKECNTDTFPMQNIHNHQVRFMEDFEKQEGVSFLIIYYTHKNEMYYVPFRDVKKFYDRAKNGGRKSFKFEEIDKKYRIYSKSGVPVHYIEALSLDLENEKN